MLVEKWIRSDFGKDLHDIVPGSEIEPLEKVFGPNKAPSTARKPGLLEIALGQQAEYLGQYLYRKI